LGVGGDRFVNVQGEGEGLASGLRGDAGWGAGTDGAEKVFEFEAEGFGSGRGERFEGEAGGGVTLARRCG
jgi:hypothetical protein